MSKLKIDFVSDISCGWCSVGLQSVEQALRNIGSDIATELNFQPFELNPNIPAGGENLKGHLIYKYGEEAAARYFAGTHDQGAQVGFDFKLNDDSRIYNTFEAHRLLHWAGLQGRQTELNHALFQAHFTENKDPGDHEVLLKCVETAQLDVVEASQVLNSDAFSQEVRELQSDWERKGIYAVPTVILNDKYIISGGRSVETYEEAIRSAIDSNATTVFEV